ncbi:AAA family ATPase [Rhizobium cremeum]|uniref:AAA domain-containing protein n=2 Tax=Rhizobium cremeum TaxID=2813827 RepID=UPI001FD4B6C6|nr:AAA domain-containing protein [Rhizobium cremeum]MCJ7997490.1 AAA family ATPase [Rhizobium cremeum]MCJ8002672.1 AAA family ATPase [Rhizobium cremeum]
MVENTVGGRYRLNKKIITGDPLRGIPDLWMAQDSGDLYYVKIWKKRGGDHVEMKALWNREVRALSRLQGYPGAAELFVRLQDLNYDDRQYYAVLDGGRRVLLSEVLRDRARSPWLSNLYELGRRRPLWEGLLRIAEALSLLHREGTLHRALSPASIFVDPDGAGEFRLSGFEWSLRVAGTDGSAAKVARMSQVVAPELEKADGEYSTATDWFDFGLVAAELFGVSARTIKKRDAIRTAVTGLQALRDGEKSIILRLLEENHEQRLATSNEVLSEIRNLIRDLSVVNAGFGRNLVLSVRLGPGTNLSKSIEISSQRKAKADEPFKQREWMEQDLRGDPRVTSRNLPYPHFVIRGEKLEYKIKPWRLNTLETWDIGYCESVEAIPRSLVDDQYFSLGQRRLEIISYPDVRKTYQTIRDRSAPWNKVFSFSGSKREIQPHLKLVHDFFRVTQQLDTVLTAARICPVQIISVHHTQQDTTIVVTPREEANRNLLAQHLGLARPSEQLRDWFKLGAEFVGTDDDDDPNRDTYSLLERKMVDSESSQADWRFLASSPEADGPQYFFRASGNFPVRPSLMYLARNHGGTIAQIKRRYEAIEDLRSHESLLRLLGDPLGTSRPSGDQEPKKRTQIELDGSKNEALRRLWETQPSFALQGPPGTGKTTLIKAFADRLFNSDTSAQILVTAHSHHTVDDVRKKLSELFQTIEEDNRPILLRLGPKEPTEHDVGPVTQSMVRRLQASELAGRVPERLKSRLAALMPDAALHDEAADVELRTMQMLIQDAANVTFTTLNSPDLADLSERGRRFDWSIIEEAGKAHGFDMAVALSESHRLLLIGDHFQLPPFNSKIFKDLLGDALRVKRAIETGEEFAPRLVDKSIVDDEEGAGSFEERCDQWRRMVDLFGRIFQNSLDESGTRGPAATLTDQHRMHPDIADLVGKVFYPADTPTETILSSPQETYEKFIGDPPFTILKDSWLPAQRIVWCDVPWKQKVEDAEGEKDGIFESPSETRAVVDVLSQLRARGDTPCEIQVLSPYNHQLSAIREAVLVEKRTGLLEHMFSSPFDLSHGKRMGATVDEFQGSEADVVIVSLVRNNPLVPWKSVGFLKEANRMNVLLSRAKQKLIIVGSWDFFKSRCTEHTSPDEEYAYIGRLMHRMEQARESGRLGWVEASR